MVSSSEVPKSAAFEALLQHWAALQLQQLGWLKTPRIQASAWQMLRGDAGFRRYARIHLDGVNSVKTVLAVFSPPDTESNQAFVEIDRFLRQHQVRAPEILSQNDEQGFFLIEDFGQTLLLDHLNSDSVDQFYGNALNVLKGIQQCPVQALALPNYDESTLLAEMHLFDQWFVPKLLSYTLSKSEHGMLEQTFQYLSQSACEQPQVLVHRDYHSRNLVVCADGGLGVIDFQDALIGPVTYDLVSLLRDCYVHWPDDQVVKWGLAYVKQARDGGWVDDVEDEVFLRWFDWMGLQRHIKVLGIFARLSLRDGKHSYLNDLPLVIGYVRRVASRYPKLNSFSCWFDEVIVRLAREQNWMSAKL